MSDPYLKLADGSRLRGSGRSPERVVADRAVLDDHDAVGVDGGVGLVRERSRTKDLRLKTPVERVLMHSIRR